MSTTPRTDAALLSSDCACNCGHTFKLLSEEKYDQGKCVYTGPDIANGNDNVVVLADFARTLETELAAEREKVRVMREQLENASAYFAIRELGDPAKLLRGKIDAALAATKEDSR